MPIKPENKSKYPENWGEIRDEVLERAGHKCEWEGCGLKNGENGLRDLNGRFWRDEQFQNGDVTDDIEFEKPGQPRKHAFKIVLTIAHLDHNPANNGEPGNRPNLRAWCQYHHLKYDHPHHMENARRTREEKKGMVSLFEDWK